MWTTVTVNPLLMSFCEAIVYFRFQIILYIVYLGSTKENGIPLEKWKRYSIEEYPFT